MRRGSPPRFNNTFYATAIAAACLLLAFGVATIIYGTRNYDLQVTQDTIIQGRILASAMSAALAFDDKKAAREYVDSLAFNPSVESAAIYDQRGNTFVGYTRPGSRTPRGT